MKWPWSQHREIVTEREEAQRRADELERHIIESLRAMRTYDSLTGAMRNELRRQAKGKT